MRHTKPVNVLLVSLLGATTLVTSCRGNTTASSDPDTPLSANQTTAIVPTNNMTAARSGHTATLFPNHQLLIAAGMARNGAFYRRAQPHPPGRPTLNLTQAHLTTQRPRHI